MNPSIDPSAGGASSPSQPTTLAAILLATFAFNDFDIVGHESVKRITIGHRMQRGDTFNVYHRSGAKVGGTWLGSLRASLLAVLGGEEIDIRVGAEGATHFDAKGFFWRQMPGSTAGRGVWERHCPIYGWLGALDTKSVIPLRPIPPTPLAPSVLLEWAGPDNLALADKQKGR